MFEGSWVGYDRAVGSTVRGVGDGGRVVEFLNLFFFSNSENVTFFFDVPVSRNFLCPYLFRSVIFIKIYFVFQSNRL